jgi:hypothetical protein
MDVTKIALTRRVLVQDSCDILNRAYRYAKDRESAQRRDRK